VGVQAPTPALSTPYHPVKPAQKKDYFVPKRYKVVVPKIVRVALRERGVPYVWGGSSPSGFDCSGLVSYLWKQFGVSLPRTTYAMIGVGSRVPNLRHARPGDLLFPHTGHVMMYLGHNRAEHAPHSGAVVTVIKATSRSYIEIRRPPGIPKGVTTSRVKLKVPEAVYRQQALG
jgi:cell wall-associated NlpC family hydrolase